MVRLQQVRFHHGWLLVSALFVSIAGQPFTCSFLLCVSTVRKRRKSLPAPVSGGEWTNTTLTNLEISIVPATLPELLNLGQGQLIHTVSPIGESLMKACDFITADLTLLTYDAADAKIRELHVPQDSTGWKLYKFLRLVDGIDSMHLESVVDDFVIHLLDALGFNDGPLVVLSKNKLAFTMNSTSVYATADVTVYHIANRFRLAVFEDKRLRGANPESADVEAQLVAEAIAAVQANIRRAEEEARKSKRAKSESEESKSTPSGSSLTDDCGRIYLIRVLGSSFYFYSAQLAPEFINFVQDYKNYTEGTELKSTLVYKLTLDSVTVPTNGSPAVPRKKSELVFRVKDDRQIVISILDRLRQIFLGVNIEGTKNEMETESQIQK
jgi:hypothetical protein